MTGVISTGGEIGDAKQKAQKMNSCRALIEMCR
jgi:hypothetical protein